MTANYFSELHAVNCTANIEKKGGFSYLSWPFAVAELLKRHPDSTWRVIDDEHGWPFWQTPVGYFVKVAVTVQGIERTQVHPVLNGANKPIANPTPFDINTAIQRCLVKAIALHGLGLYIYAGEDLPDSATVSPIVKPTGDAWERLSEDEQAFLQKVADGVGEYLAAGDAVTAWAFLQAQQLESEEKIALWTRLDSKQRAALKKAEAQLKEAA